MKIGFVFTNYNNSKFTLDAIESILKNDFASSAHIIIVDNKSDEKEIEILNNISSRSRNISIIYNEINEGYFKGLNTGIKFLRENHKDIIHIVIGNNDLIFPPEFMQSIIENENLFQLYPVISPDIITLDGAHQNPHVIKRISIFREFIFDLYHSHYFIARLITTIAHKTRSFTDRRDEEQFMIPQTIWQGYGACYILSPVFFKYFDQLWAPSFLMYEEFFLSKQVENIGMKVYYAPGIKIIHQQHSSVSKIPKKKLWEFSRDSHKIYRKYIKIFH